MCMAVLLVYLFDILSYLGSSCDSNELGSFDLSATAGTPQLTVAKPFKLPHVQVHVARIKKLQMYALRIRVLMVPNNPIKCCEK